MYQHKVAASLIKITVSVVIGLPALFVAVGQVNNIDYWFMPFVALAAIVALLKWNGVFDEPTQKPIKRGFVSKRRTF